MSSTQTINGQPAVYNAGTITLRDGTGAALQVDVNGNLKVAASFSGTVTTSPTFAQNPGAGSPTPAYGLIDSSFRPQVSIATALPPGSNVIGHVITDTGSTTAVTGTVTISGTVTANAGTNLNTSLLALESGGNLATIAGTVSASKVNVNISSGSIANTTFAVTQATAANLNATVVGTGTFVTQSTLSAETTKVIGTVRTADGSGNLLTSTSNALDVNLKTSSITVNTQEASPTTIFDGKTTVTNAGTRVTLAGSTTVKYVTIKALSTNTGFIYVGNSSVASTNGLQIQAGESVNMAISNLNTVNIDSSVNGEGVTYLAVN